MPKCVVERDISGARKLSATDLQGVDIAPDEATVREHATKGRFPANRVSRISTIIDPTTSD